MKVFQSKKNKALCLGLVVAFMFCGCGVKVQPMRQEPVRLDIVDVSDAWNVILNSCTSEFIGGHPIDEGFLAWVTNVYGEAAIVDIASYSPFDKPEVWYDFTGKSIHVLWHYYCKRTGIMNDNRTYEVDFADKDYVTFDFTGDISFAENVATTTFMDSQLNGITDCISAPLLDEMVGSNVLIVNNEFAYTTRGTPIEGKTYTFRANPSTLGNMYAIGVDAVNVANNHVYDFGYDGMIDTLDTLEKVNMPYIGAGYNLNEAMRPIYYIVGGKKIAVCSATQIERSTNYTKEATENSPGVLKCLHDELFCEEIALAKKNADEVIVVCHWGTEGTNKYGLDQKMLARDFARAGADIIIGGHTHTLQGLEYIDDVPVYYSLGNFYFSTTMSMPADYKTGIAQIRFKKDGSHEEFFIPCHFSNGYLSLTVDKEDKREIYDEIVSISENISITDDGQINNLQKEVENE